MKLRTKIIWISCIAMLLASFTGAAIIWAMTAKSQENEALVQAYQNFYVLKNELEQNLEERPDPASEKVYLEYFFKMQKDDYNICYLTHNNLIRTEEWDEIYNHTVFGPEELESLEYQEYRLTRYAELIREGKRYLVFCQEIREAVLLYRIEEITYVRDNLYRLAFGMLLITLCVTGAAMLVLSLVLKRMLQPLKELNDTAARMAENLYDQRVPIHRNDEIGQLGASFNKMAEAVEARTQSLEESEKKKTLFMGDLTHELKTPMTAISGYAQTLLAARLEPEDQEEALHYIYKECGRLERLSKKMMKLLELDQEEKLELKCIPAKRVFEAAARSCKINLQNKQMTLKCFEQGETFWMDEDLMTDVLINLIDNGIKASDPGAEVVLRAYKNCIEVQDFGCGIPEEEQGKILEPFYMIDKSRSRKSGGAGLGLALTAMIAKKHHIQLQIDSEVGRGTRMILQFV